MIPMNIWEDDEYSSVKVSGIVCQSLSERSCIGGKNNWGFNRQRQLFGRKDLFHSSWRGKKRTHVASEVGIIEYITVRDSYLVVMTFSFLLAGGKKRIHVASEVGIIEYLTVRDSYLVVRIFFIPPGGGKRIHIDLPKNHTPRGFKALQNTSFSAPHIQKKFPAKINAGSARKITNCCCVSNNFSFISLQRVLLSSTNTSMGKSISKF